MPEEEEVQTEKTVGFAGMVDGYWLPKSTLIRDHAKQNVAVNHEHLDLAAIDELRRLQASTYQPSRIRKKTKAPVGIEACPHFAAMDKGHTPSKSDGGKFESCPAHGSGQEGTRLICRHAPKKDHGSSADEQQARRGKGTFAELIAALTACFNAQSKEPFVAPQPIETPCRDDIHRELLDAITRVHQVDCLEQVGFSLMICFKQLCNYFSPNFYFRTQSKFLT